ncbi:MAG: glycine--tRNA ligase subunit beta [Actinomycetota bacterium]|nr:glycine--tRNA ligase subunit beta [Actinomycetota bacterium]
MENKLIFEIGTEELPSSSINEAMASLKDTLSDKLSMDRLNYSHVETYGTPRRLICIVYGLKDIQDSLEKIVMGPPEKISYDGSGKPTQAASGFAKSLGIAVENLERFKTEKGIYIGKKIFEEGKKTVRILPSLLYECIFSIPFSKQMTWANWQIRFARPIRWILAMYGSEVLDIKIESLKSGNVTYGHRTLCPLPIQINHSEELLEKLEKEGKVIVDGKKRKEAILSGIRMVEEQFNDEDISVVTNSDLLEEVVNLVEIPNVLAGSFPEEFLQLPKDILIKAIEYHQRYFAVVDKKGDVVPKFIVVQNGISDKNREIIKGNERVLKARLSDASFFYSEDKKSSWERWIEKLKGVVFYSKLGSMYDKELRLEKISKRIISELKGKGFDIIDDFCDFTRRASLLCKADLVTNLVVEFPELQGVVGREYAKERNENPEVCEAIFEHYLPRFYGDMLPGTTTGTIISIADKIDTVTGMFLAGAKPSGSEDPFALRRRALGIVLSIFEKNYDIDIHGLVKYNIDLYKLFLKQDESQSLKVLYDIIDFIIARFKFTFEKDEKRTDLIDAITAADIFSLLDINKRYEAISKMVLSGKLDEITLPMIRCKNIVKGMSFNEINPQLLKEESEKSLFKALLSKYEKIKSFNCQNRYDESINEIIDLRKTVDEFFDKVLIMDKAEEIRSNRINLVKRTLDLYMTIADFSKIYPQ